MPSELKMEVQTASVADAAEPKTTKQSHIKEFREMMTKMEGAAIGADAENRLQQLSNETPECLMAIS